MWNAEFGMRNFSERVLRGVTLVFPFRIPHSAFRIERGREP